MKFIIDLLINIEPIINVSIFLILNIRKLVNAINKITQLSKYLLCLSTKPTINKNKDNLLVKR